MISPLFELLDLGNFKLKRLQGNNFQFPFFEARTPTVFKFLRFKLRNPKFKKAFLKGSLESKEEIQFGLE